MAATDLFDLSNVDEILTLSLGVFEALPDLAKDADSQTLLNLLRSVIANQKASALNQQKILDTLAQNSVNLAQVIVNSNNSINLIKALIQDIGQRFAAFGTLSNQIEEIDLLNQTLTEVKKFTEPTHITGDPSTITIVPQPLPSTLKE